VATPTPTPTPTATPPCIPDCCQVELCYGGDCTESCSCAVTRLVYLSICRDQRCELSGATGIYDDPSCSGPAQDGYYSDGTGCYYWDGSSSLTYQGPC
jgi:hypothetical protein